MYNIKQFQQIMTISLYLYLQKDKMGLKTTIATNLELPTAPDKGTDVKDKASQQVPLHTKLYTKCTCICKSCMPVTPIC